MYSRSFLCEEAKIKQRIPLKKELCEIGQETIWESRFTSFFAWLFWGSTLNEIKKKNIRDAIASETLNKMRS